jgi:uncharacterized membrane-anchored protein
MISLPPKSWLAIGVVAVAQTALLGWMVFDRISLLAHGREIVAEVVPVDPRDLFRGDYVVLSYRFSQTGDVDAPEGTRQGDSLYVTMKPTTGDADWQIVAVDLSYPASTAPENVVLKGVVDSVWSPGSGSKPRARLRYGIESYFVPEGTGRRLEDLVRDKKLATVIAVGRDGEAAIKALMIDGKREVEEPLL